jgi:hypothetical protein
MLWLNLKEQKKDEIMHLAVILIVDAGSGAHDDAGGCIAAWEALKLLKNRHKTQRTLRTVGLMRKTVKWAARFMPKTLKRKARLFSKWIQVYSLLCYWFSVGFPLFGGKQFEPLLKNRFYYRP